MWHNKTKLYFNIKKKFDLQVKLLIKTQIALCGKEFTIDLGYITNLLLVH